MHLQSGDKIISGIEPVDELLGGLDRGQLYLVHGEASGKSLFGIKFLIEGLKQGESGALVIRYSPEDAVRRFARLGYDCLEDVYSGRLVILEYSDDIIQKIGKLRELTPVLRELEWLLGETKPSRLIFDPVASVLTGAEGALETRARQFAEWTRSFGATVVLIANESNQEIIKCFEPLVAESFRFDVRDIGDRAARFIAFEKSEIPDQAIEVDPSRGVFLLGRVYSLDEASYLQSVPQPPSIAELQSIREELRAAHSRKPSETPKPAVEIDPRGETSVPTDRTPKAPANGALDSNGETSDRLQTRKLTPVEEREFQTPRASATPQSDPTPIEELQFEEPRASAPVIEEFLDDLSGLLDDLTGSASPLDLDLPELKLPPLGGSPDRTIDIAEQTDAAPLNVASVTAPSGGVVDPKHQRSPRRGRASDVRIDSAIAARAVEMLLHSPDAAAEFSLPASHRARPRSSESRQPEPLGDADVRPKDFNVLIIEDDSETCDLVTQTLDDYSLEVVHDGVSGLAKLISFKPDLVVLDFDLPVIDGFKVLTLIRSALNVPIIIVSGSRMRAIDRVMASELGADYYLTKPFSAKELKHKARQLIARYRGLSSWIINPSSASKSVALTARGDEPAGAASAQEFFTPYAEFAVEVEKRVKAAMDTGAQFSIVGCRLEQMTADGGRPALKLFEIVRSLARDADLTSTNPRNDLVILLADAGASGARAFAGRLRAKVSDELSQEPVLWMRSFPDLEESAEASESVHQPQRASEFKRRSGDQPANTQGQAKPTRLRTENASAEKAVSGDSYIDFLDQL
jgi:DNA-binding response OmpR family regulator/KaiC/GvpD/RAD55 family RecA-like ATPase